MLRVVVMGLAVALIATAGAAAADAAPKRTVKKVTIAHEGGQNVAAKPAPKRKGKKLTIPLSGTMLGYEAQW